MNGGNSFARRLQALPFVLGVAACGGSTATSNGDADASAASSPLVGCSLGGDGTCAGDPRCCSTPIYGSEVDLDHSSVAAKAAVTCYPPPAVAGQACSRPTTGDRVCFMRRAAGATRDEIVVTTEYLFDIDGFTPCDAATKAQVCKLAALDGVVPCP